MQNESGLIINNRQVKMPKMVLFDYGHTLVYEREFDGVKAAKAVMQHAVRNPGNLTAEEVSLFSEKIFSSLEPLARENEIEVHYHMFDKFVYEYL